MEGFRMYEKNVVLLYVQISMLNSIEN